MMGLDSYFFWEEDYKSLEADFLEFVTYVPLSEEHMDIWSLKLANQLLLIGSSIDSFFKCAMASLRKQMIQDHIDARKYDFLGLEKEGVWEWYFYQGIGYTIEDFKDESEFYNNLLKDNQPNMGLYRTIFEDFYQLSTKKIYVLRTQEEFTPFKEWAGDKSPQWWLSYRDLKHDRFQNRKDATLKTVLDALSALFLLNVYHIDTRKYLVNKRVIRSNMKLDHPYFLNSRKKYETIQPIIAKTDLFGYVWESGGHWEDPWSILDPGNVYDI